MTLQTFTCLHDGLERAYHVRLPAGYSGPSEGRPVVVCLHAGEADAALFDEGMTGGTWGAAADDHGLISVFPEGTEGKWNDGAATNAHVSHVDDVGFVESVAADVMAQFSPSGARFLVGMSNGAQMTLKCALERPGWAGIAAVCALAWEGSDGETPQSACPALFCCGRMDPVIPFTGGESTLFNQYRGECLSFEDQAAWWAGELGTRKKGSKVLVNEVPDGTFVWRQEYRNGLMRTFDVWGGGHQWPGGDPTKLPPLLFGPMCDDIDVSAEICAFFAEQLT